MDSGGPVLWQNPRTKRLVNIGIISWGAECGKYPNGNTKVGSYIDWIVSQTPGMNNIKYIIENIIYLCNFHNFNFRC